MSNLAPRILHLVTRLSGREGGALAFTPPLDRAAMESEYRQALRRWFELSGQGETADLAEVDRIHQELLRLMDEVGEPRATRLRWHWAREWWEETGVCPFCGERGEYHDPEQGEEATHA